MLMNILIYSYDQYFYFTHSDNKFKLCHSFLLNKPTLCLFLFCYYINLILAVIFSLHALYLFINFNLDFLIIIIFLNIKLLSLVKIK